MIASICANKRSVAVLNLKFHAERYAKFHDSPRGIALGILKFSANAVQKRHAKFHSELAAIRERPWRLTKIALRNFMSG